MSDIHGCLAEFNVVLSMVLKHLSDNDTKLVLLGDYIHGGDDSKGVLDRIMELQNEYGEDRVIALAGNHDLWLLDESASINHMNRHLEDDEDDEKYINWIENLPLYYTEGNTIFVHAGIDEQDASSWEWSDEYIFTMKFPAETGKIYNFDKKVVAGHVGTSSIANNPRFHDIYFDGESHYYIDGTVLVSRKIPVLMVDTDTDKYYRVTENGYYFILPYDEEY